MTIAMGLSFGGKMRFVSLLGLIGSAATLSIGNVAFATEPPSVSAGTSPGLISAVITTSGIYTAHTTNTAINEMASGVATLSGGASRFALSLPAETGAAAAAASRWNAWVAYSRNNVGYSFAPLQSGGTVDVGLIGVDYTLDNKTVVGVALASDRTRVDLSFSGGNLRGSGYTISPYIGIPLNRQWTLDASLGFGRTNVDTSQAGVNGSFRDQRVVGNVGVAYRQAVGNWLLTGRGSYISVDDKLGAYTLSNGTFVTSGSVNISQLRFGGQAAFNAGNVVPYVGLSYVYDLRRPNQQSIAGQNAANDKDAWVPAIGLQFKSGGALYGGIQYSSEQSRSQVKNNQILFNLGLRF